MNVAIILQALAQPGSVCVSGATYEQVKKVMPLSFADLGPQQVKDIEEPIRAYVAGRLGVTPSAAALANASKSLPLPDKPSIAVLPFQNMSGDLEQEYFADGIAEDVLTTLSKIHEGLDGHSSQFELCIQRADKGHPRNRPKQ